jgi:hypothetical protein
LAIALAALFLASPAVAEERAITGDLRSQCLSHDPILHQHCLSYIAGVYEMTVLMGEVYELFDDPVARLAEHSIAVCYGKASLQIDAAVQIFLSWAEKTPKEWSNPRSFGVKKRCARRTRATIDD